VDFEVEVSADADLRQALAVIRQVADDMEADPEWQALILHPVEILGVDAIKHSGHLLRAWITTSPLKQWVVGREFRLRINEAFHLHGIQPRCPPTGRLKCIRIERVRQALGPTERVDWRPCCLTG